MRPLPLSAIILSQDLAAASLSTRILESSGFNVTKAGTAEMVNQLSKRNRFDLAIYDHDCGALDPGGSPRPNAARIIMALVGTDNIKQIVGKHVHFIVQKPFTGDVLARSLRAAYGSIARDRRINFRQEVSIDTLSCDLFDHGETRALKSAKIVNVSQTGLCLKTEEVLPQKANVQVRFAIPGGRVLQISGSVVWAHISCRAGIYLTEKSSDDQVYFEEWLNSMLPDAGGLAPPLQRSDLPRSRNWFKPAAPRDGDKQIRSGRLQ